MPNLKVADTMIKMALSSHSRKNRHFHTKLGKAARQTEIHRNRQSRQGEGGIGRIHTGGQTQANITRLLTFTHINQKKIEL